MTPEELVPLRPWPTRAGRWRPALLAPPDLDSEAGQTAVIQSTWSLACTGKFIWPIPDRGLRKRLHRITAPTLIVWGHQDRLVKTVYADEFAARHQGFPRRGARGRRPLAPAGAAGAYVGGSDRLPGRLNMASPQAEAIKEQLRVFAGVARSERRASTTMRASYETFIDADRPSRPACAGRRSTPVASPPSGPTPTGGAPGPGAAVRARRRLRHRLGRLLPQVHRPPGQRLRLPGAERRLPPGAGASPPGAGRGLDDGLPVAARPGLRARPTSPSRATRPAAASPWPRCSASARTACPCRRRRCRCRRGSTWRPPASR